MILIYVDVTIHLTNKDDNKIIGWNLRNKGLKIPKV
jgi:hypothetical protein